MNGRRCVGVNSYLVHAKKTPCVPLLPLVPLFFVVSNFVVNERLCLLKLLACWTLCFIHRPETCVRVCCALGWCHKVGDALAHYVHVCHGGSNLKMQKYRLWHLGQCVRCARVWSGVGMKLRGRCLVFLLVQNLWDVTFALSSARKSSGI